MKSTDVENVTFAQIATYAIREAGEFLDLNSPNIKPVMILGAIVALVVFGLYKAITAEESNYND